MDILKVWPAVMDLLFLTASSNSISSNVIIGRTKSSLTNMLIKKTMENPIKIFPPVYFNTSSKMKFGIII